MSKSLQKTENRFLVFLLIKSLNYGKIMQINQKLGMYNESKRQKL